MVFFFEIFFNRRSTVGELGNIDLRREAEFGVADPELDVVELPVDDDDPDESWLPTLPPLASVTTCNGALGGEISKESAAGKRNCHTSYTVT